MTVTLRLTAQTSGYYYKRLLLPRMLWFVQTQNNNHYNFQNPQIPNPLLSPNNNFLHKRSQRKYHKVLVNAARLLFLCLSSVNLHSFSRNDLFLIQFGPKRSGTNSHSTVNPVVRIGYIFPTIEASSFYIEHNRHESHFKNIIVFF